MNSDDLIVELLKNKANWGKMTLALADTEVYQCGPIKLYNLKFKSHISGLSKLLKLLTFTISYKLNPSQWLKELEGRWN